VYYSNEMHFIVMEPSFDILNGLEYGLIRDTELHLGRDLASQRHHNDTVDMF
jgi:hypothetical protein